MERIKLNMDDPIFGPGIPKTAVIPITVSPSGLSSEVELFLGPNDTTKIATSGLIPFTSTGVQQSVSLPITMPSPGGDAYHVYIDVYAEGYLLVAYVATEDVLIPSGEVGPPVWG